MVTTDEAREIQKERTRNCIIISVISFLILAAAAVLLSKYVAKSTGEKWFFVVFAGTIELLILTKIRFEQFFKPKEVLVKVVKNEAVTVTQKNYKGASGPAATYGQVEYNLIQMTLVDEKGAEFIKRFPYRSELGTIKEGDELSIMSFVYEPVVVKRSNNKQNP